LESTTTTTKTEVKEEAENGNVSKPVPALIPAAETPATNPTGAVLIPTSSQPPNVPVTVVKVDGKSYYAPVFGPNQAPVVPAAPAPVEKNWFSLLPRRSCDHTSESKRKQFPEPVVSEETREKFKLLSQFCCREGGDDFGLSGVEAPLLKNLTDAFVVPPEKKEEDEAMKEVGEDGRDGEVTKKEEVVAAAAAAPVVDETQLARLQALGAHDPKIQAFLKRLKQHPVFRPVPKGGFFFLSLYPCESSPRLRAPTHDL
jgi:hypothetical protein